MLTSVISIQPRVSKLSGGKSPDDVVAELARDIESRLPRNLDKITLVKEVWNVPKDLPFHKGTLVPFRAGGTVGWRML